MSQFLNLASFDLRNRRRCRTQQKRRRDPHPFDVLSNYTRLERFDIRKYVRQLRHKRLKPLFVPETRKPLQGSRLEVRASVLEPREPA